MTRKPTLVERLLANEPRLARAYAAAGLLAVVETIAFAPPESRGVALLLVVVFLPFSFLMVVGMFALHILINPIWNPAVTRFFASLGIAAAPLFVVAGLVIYPTAPPEILSAGSGAVTGGIGIAWASHYLYRRHGLNRRISPGQFWAAVTSGADRG